MSSDNLEVAHRLYKAFQSHDAAGMLAVLAPEFRGVVSDGMPNHFGGTYHGPEEMLRRCWAPVFAAIDVCPSPEEFLSVSPDRIVVVGRYLGTARSTGRALSAAFVHILRFADGKVTEIVQITDTGQWRDALAS
jgi:uncharacterized protein